MYSIHRDPRFWKNPAVFDPDRFMNGADDDLPKYAYMPFGGGPRICIGNAFAMMEAKILLATIAQRRRMRLQEGFVPEMDPVVTLRPESGMKMVTSAR
jgi:cytochrome P450